jgi:hypothetical protein
MRRVTARPLWTIYFALLALVMIPTRAVGAASHNNTDNDVASKRCIVRQQLWSQGPSTWTIDKVSRVIPGDNRTNRLGKTWFVDFDFGPDVGTMTAVLKMSNAWGRADDDGVILSKKNMKLVESTGCQPKFGSYSFQIVYEAWTAAVDKVSRLV